MPLRGGLGHPRRESLRRAQARAGPCDDPGEVGAQVAVARRQLALLHGEHCRGLEGLLRGVRRPVGRGRREGAEVPLAVVVGAQRAVPRRREEAVQVHLGVVRDLREPVRLADEFLHVVHAHLAGDAPHGLAHLGEVAHQGLDGGLVHAGHEALETAVLGLLLVHLRGDAHMAGIQLAPAADRAADGHHGCGAEPQAVGPQADELDGIRGSAEAAVRPDLHAVADSGLHERMVRQHRADLARKACATQGVKARGARAAVEPGEREHVRPRLGDADSDRADARHHGDLHDHLGVRVGRLELVDELGQVLDRVQVVVVRGADEVRADGGVPRRRDGLGHLGAGQVPAFAGLRALADLDLDPLRGVHQQRRHPESAGRDLHAAVLRVLAVHVADLAALAVHAQHVGPEGGLGVGPEGRLALAAERH